MTPFSADAKPGSDSCGPGGQAVLGFQRETQPKLEGVSGCCQLSGAEGECPVSRVLRSVSQEPGAGQTPCLKTQPSEPRATPAPPSMPSPSQEGGALCRPCHETAHPCPHPIGAVSTPLAAQPTATILTRTVRCQISIHYDCVTCFLFLDRYKSAHRGNVTS